MQNSHVLSALVLLAAACWIWGTWLTLDAYRCHARTQLRSVLWQFRALAFAVVGAPIVVLVSAVELFTPWSIAPVMLWVLVGFGSGLILLGAFSYTMALFIMTFWEHDDWESIRTHLRTRAFRQRLLMNHWLPEEFRASGTPSSIGMRLGLLLGAILVLGSAAIAWFSDALSPRLDIVKLLFPLYGAIVGIGYILLSLLRGRRSGGARS